MKIWMGALIFASLLSACESAQDGATNSYFVTPLTDGTFLTPLNSDRSSLFRDANGEGFAFGAGTDSEGLVARAGLIPGTATQAWPSAGTATMSGQYELVKVSGIDLNNSYISGFTSFERGNLTLTANFAGNTLNGTSNNGLLIVNGRTTGQTLGGGVTYNGVSGALQGVAGADQAFGVFHGNSEDLIYAGGFKVAP